MKAPGTWLRAGALLACAITLAAASEPDPSWRLTPEGLGPVRIGMTRAQVTTLVGAPLEGEEFTEGCIEMQATRGWTHVWFMFEEGRLTRLSVGGETPIRTPRGIGPGDTEEAVRRAYGSGLIAEPHEYQDPPARYLTFWTQPDRRGVRFETNERGRVDTIHAGGPSIQYVEGCL